MLWQQIEDSSGLAFVPHRLPSWFMVFALFLPRVSLAVAWLDGILAPFHLTGPVPLLFAVVVPRALVLYLIYLDRGVGLWFVFHLAVALLVWAGGGNTYRRRRVWKQGGGR
ncbi:MAG: hypothetical protein JSS95_14005 [Acidobacteria bacterium]|nr:hypothetical protein [Acidobacteriota bacterium]